MSKKLSGIIIAIVAFVAGLMCAKVWPTATAEDLSPVETLEARPIVGAKNPRISATGCAEGWQIIEVSEFSFCLPADMRIYQPYVGTDDAIVDVGSNVLFNADFTGTGDSLRVGIGITEYPPTWELFPYDYGPTIDDYPETRAFLMIDGQLGVLRRTDDEWGRDVAGNFMLLKVRYRAVAIKEFDIFMQCRNCRDEEMMLQLIESLSFRNGRSR